MVYMMILFMVGTLFEAAELIKNKYWHELKVFSAFSAAALVIGIFYLLGISILNPVKGIEYVVKDLLHLNYR